MEANKNRNGGRQKAKVPYLLSGYVYCDVCGGAMSGSATTNTKGIRTRYYRCNTSMRQGKVVCANRGINADDLEKAVLDTIRGVLYDEGVLETLVEKVQVEYAELQKSETDSVAVMKEARDKARKAMDNFYDRIREGDHFDEIDEAEFQRTKDAFRAAEHNLRQIETKGHLPKVPPAKIREYIQTTFGELVNEKSTANYRALLENLIDSVRVNLSTVTVKLKVRYSWCARGDSNPRPTA
ncbi:MAG: zinc ribbon domain-containing protein [Schwartzia sp.]|nr:zinc ribbon domain-containing protein [Schwartzia sp. (in: firmicutes)]